MITIVDYGLGNLNSIKNMFRFIGVESEIASDPNVINEAQKLLLPGVGAFDAAMSKLNESNLIPVLNKKVLEDKIPILGICLGMQLLTNGSEEGKLSGLGWIDAQTIKFKFDTGEKIPHMGWNKVEQVSDSKLISGLPSLSRYYFVHSYYVKVAVEKNSILKTQYGGLLFDSAIQNNNIMGTQFHPEKSHKFGMKLLSNFAAI
ncbi:MAG: imidazole glycerol phosphate synthase subunit HisH [Bacteroidetes bacterium]|nr:MAG: imidazole glycerol phosphate synthase subunit HisH [Bacteroidota bacterium]